MSYKIALIGILLVLLSFAAKAEDYNLMTTPDCNHFNSIDQNGTKLYTPDSNGNTILCGYNDYNSLRTDLNQQKANIELYRTQCNERISIEQSKANTAIEAQATAEATATTLTIENGILKQTNADLNNEYIDKTNSCLAQITQNKEETTKLNTTTMNWMLGDKAAYEQKINSDNKEIMNNMNDLKNGVIIIALLIFLFLIAKFAPKLVHKADEANGKAKQKALESLEQLRAKRFKIEQQEKKLAEQTETPHLEEKQ